MGKSVFIYFLSLCTIVIFTFLACSKDDESEEFDRTGQGPIPDGDYYVAPWGNDDSLGTFESPWASWQKAFETARPGDIIYFRGGVYKPSESAYWSNVTMIDPTAGSPVGHSGEPGNPICYYNYPDENPILDCSLIIPTGNFNTALELRYVNHVKFRGLTIRNVVQGSANVTVRVIVM